MLKYLIKLRRKLCNMTLLIAKVLFLVKYLKTFAEKLGKLVISRQPSVPTYTIV